MDEPERMSARKKDVSRLNARREASNTKVALGDRADGLTLATSWPGADTCAHALIHHRGTGAMRGPSRTGGPHQR